MARPGTDGGRFATRDEAELLEQALAYAQWGVGVLAPEGDLVRLSNPRFDGLLGGPAARTRGRAFPGLFLPTLQATIRAELARAREKGHCAFEVHGDAEGGKTVHLYVDVTRFRDPADRPNLVVNVHDIADEVQHRAALHAAREREHELRSLQQQNEFRARFVSTAAHELNAPLTPLRVQLHLLREGRFGPLTPEQRQATQLLERNLKRMEYLVHDMMDATRIQAGRLELNLVDVDLRTVINETVDAFREAYDKEGVTLDVQAAPSLPAAADPARLGQVLANLLSNALKFTPMGGWVRVEAQTTERGSIECGVTDSGVGLAPDQISRLFQPFAQVHPVPPKGSQGTGLGLFISRGIVEGHGGAIWCRSAGRNKGSVFGFSLPAAGPPSASRQAASTAATDPEAET